jgi:hypothetical protein
VNRLIFYLKDEIGICFCAVLFDHKIQDREGKKEGLRKKKEQSASGGG